MTRLFPKCPWCGSEDTIAQIMLAEGYLMGLYPAGTFLSLKQEVVMPKMERGESPFAIFVYKDVCANVDCGRERVTKVQRINVTKPESPLNRQQRRHMEPN